MNFFNDQTILSFVKAHIVQNYFWAWAKVVTSWADRIGFIDLFCGPGKYDSGKDSTPLLILKTALKERILCQKLFTFFNDIEASFVKQLQKNIAEIGIKDLVFPPIFQAKPVDKNYLREFRPPFGGSLMGHPALVFLDPIGYKGLSQDLIKLCMEPPGSECIVFFNFNRIQSAAANCKVCECMNDLFLDRAPQLKEVSKSDLEIGEKEQIFVTAFVETVKSSLGKDVFHLAFRFKINNRISHHIIFLTKHFKGYEIMKSVMMKLSEHQDLGAVSFGYTHRPSEQGLLFETQTEFFEEADFVNKIMEMLSQEFQGKTLAFDEIYKTHSRNTPFLYKHYRAALIKMEELGAIATDPPKEKRRKNSFTKDVKVTFIKPVSEPKHQKIYIQETWF